MRSHLVFDGKYFKTFKNHYEYTILLMAIIFSTSDHPPLAAYHIIDTLIHSRLEESLDYMTKFNQIFNKSCVCNSTIFFLMVTKPKISFYIPTSVKYAHIDTLLGT